MKRKIQYFPFAILIGLSFNSFAGTHQQSWTPSIQPKNCVGTHVMSGQFTANTNTGILFFDYSKSECKEVIDKGYASGVRGVVKGDVDYDKWGPTIKYGLQNNRFNFSVYKGSSYTFPAPVKKGTNLEIESADWIR
ncbi:hypothetical protein [Escherichia coli]|uniref:hypothetical protein n=1 Tax=Escherichia coli TaxID=562 RepID=UPI000BE4D271|nr:hypothetical protein [Escherichia coli]